MTKYMDSYSDETYIGSGTYSKVYKIDDNRASKYIKADSVTHIPSSSIWEVSIPTSLRHRNIVKIEEVVLDEDGVHIIMPLYQPISKIDTTIMYKLLHALRYMHRNNIIHRDLKRYNILMDDDEPIIIDFSIARVGLLPAMSPNVYTLGCRPPYVISHKYGYEADVYALGMTFLSILYNISNLRLSRLSDESIRRKISRAGDKGRIISLMVRGSPIDDIMKDPIFSNMTEPSYQDPVYNICRPLSDIDISMLDDSMRYYRKTDPYLRKVALSLLSQIEDPQRYSNFVVCVAITITSDNVQYSLRRESLDKIIRCMYIEIM